MRVDIYKARKTPDPGERRFVFVPNGTDIAALPEELSNSFQGLMFEKTIDIYPGETRIALDTDEAICNINSKGYHVQGTRINIRVSAGQ